MPGRGGRNAVEHGLAVAGLILMLASFVWLQLHRDSAMEAVTSQRKSPSRGGLATMVVIDPGHGGQDTGAIRNGVLEKDLSLDVARRIERLALERGFQTMMTRRNDEWISLAGRAAAANRARNCMFVSIHFDEGGRAAATGVQTFYAARQAPKTSIPSWLPFLQPILSESGNLQSQSLAGFIQEALVARTHAFNRGTTAQQFYVVANVRHPAVLVEGGFLSNNEDIAKLTMENYREELALAITEGLVRYRDIVSEQQATLAVGSAAPE